MKQSKLQETTLRRGRLWDRMAHHPIRVSRHASHSMSDQFSRAICGDLAQAERREWWIANGRGGYAGGTIAGSLDPALSRIADRAGRIPAWYAASYSPRPMQL